MPDVPSSTGEDPAYDRQMQLCKGGIATASPVGQFPTATANKCSSATKVVGVDVLMISGCPNPKDPIVQVIIYTAWNIWKERCRRNSDNRSFERADLCCVIRQDIVNYRMAVLTEGE